MDRILVKIKKIREDRDVFIPSYATPGAAGVDLSASTLQDIVLNPREIVRVPTGLAIELPGPHVVALVFARSGLSSKFGVTLVNSVGVIDSDYRGEIQVPLINHGSKQFVIHNGDRIAQMLFMPVYLADFQLEKELGITERGEGGFGSTGV